MALPLWTNNVFAYFLQMAILATAGTLLAYILRLRIPRVSLIYWQVLLLGCLALPVLQKWQKPIAVPAVTDMQMMRIPAWNTNEISDPQARANLPVSQTVVLVFASGAFLRILWLGMGLIRLRLLLRGSERLEQMPPGFEEVSTLIGSRANFYFSNEIDSPATFGLVTPVVILPRSFPTMSEACREAVLCHELLHVRRRDWLLAIIEEVIRTAFWFHPAVWWLLSRIHLAREQSVDHEVVRLTGCRQPYLNSLLEIARMHGRPKAVPAPLFLRERHLAQRVALLIKEVSMNRLRLVLSMVTAFVLLAGTVHIAAAWFPLTGDSEPEMNAPLNNPVRMGGNVLGSRLIEKVAPVYPDLARRTRLQGVVILEVTVDEEGYVSNVKILRGHPILSQSAVEAVQQWRYGPTLLNGKPIPVISTVEVSFAFPDTPITPTQAGDQVYSPEVITEGPISPQPGNHRQVATYSSISLGGAVGYSAGPFDEDLPPSSVFREPQLSLNYEYLLSMANAKWPDDVDRSRSIIYIFVVEASGEIRNLKLLRGPDIPQIADELYRTTVVQAGSYNNNPEAYECIVEIKLLNNQGADEIEGPVLLKSIEPQYTEEAKAAKVEGIVVLQATVRKNGSVDTFKVLRGLGFGLDERAINTVEREWKFSPGMKDGNPVDSEVTIEVAFHLS